MTPPKKSPTATDAEILDELSHIAARDAVDRGITTARDRAWSDALGQQLEARMAELRRGLTPEDPPLEIAPPIRPSTLAMARDAVLAGIARITAAMGGAGAVQLAHRNLTRLSDDDLRRLYDLIDPTARD